MLLIAILQFVIYKIKLAGKINEFILAIKH